MKKIQKYMKKYQIHDLVLSDDLKEILEFQNQNLQVNRKIHLLDGKGLMPYLVKEILEYILEKQKTKTELEDLYLCMKEPKQIYIENISYLAHYFRTVNIITPSISNFQKIADKIEEKENIIITVTNNKRKSLKKSKLIVNFDYTEKELKQYTIYRRAIVISMEEKGDYNYTGFDGIQIRQIKIDTSDEIKAFFQKYHLLKNCSLTTLYESLINEKQGFTQIKTQMQKDQIKIIKLYGRKGAIEDKEYLKNAS